MGNAYTEYENFVGVTGTIPRSRFDKIYNMLVHAFRLNTQRSVVTGEAQTLLFTYVKRVSDVTASGGFLSERIGDYAYTRTASGMTDLFDEFEQACQVFAVGDDGLAFGAATADSVNRRCSCGS